MASPAAAAARANSLSRIFSSPSPRVKQPKRNRKIKGAATPSVAHSAPLLSPPFGPLPMASPAATVATASSRANGLFSIFSPSPPTEKPPKAEPDADQILRKPLRRIRKALIRQRDPDKLVSMFVQASSASPRFRDQHHLYDVAVSRLTSFGRPDGIQAIIDAQKPFLETSTAEFAARVIRLYGRASMPIQAAATFHQLPARHKSTMTFNAVLAAYAKAGDLDALTAAFQEIPAVHPSIVPDVYSYNALIRTLCHKSDLSAALDAVHLMKKHSVSPDIITFNSLLDGFHNSGRNDEAEAVWEMIKESHLEPDAKCYNAKLRGLVAQGRIDDAAAVLERLEKDGPKSNIVSYNELIRGYCQAGRFQEAKKVYHNLMKNQCAPNKVTYETLMPHLLQAGELDCALRYCYEIFGSKRFFGVKWGVLQDVVNALVDASRLVEATKLVELDWQKYHHRKGLRMPPSAGTDEEESISGEKECESGR
ncbi:pentatricopeptide repeat-containing protein At1g55890, mitochondrial-like [Triticum urartu]|nr:pentatricopeptide repeat-containing protein At1g55890, mitochondrial-like [Triticum urartu]XP_048564878.1 pentatricopeptide repeat-containing protein At1g55890, mitochondrial-like [Triticum urartu]XP_048564879.1 pentatricopeptide repeat-containing protein At1g55890, mitochondrial-like [Triticum urartu]XP_048564881.1 pentatricopeptide repeat-containing protein At1g55890, mitochondrial-like [Triticum urartu]